MMPRDLMHAEADLSWYYTVLPTMIEIGAQDIDPDSVRTVAKSGHYTDRQMRAVERARPIRQTLSAIGTRSRQVLRLSFEPRAYRGAHAVDYLLPYGPRLAGIVWAMRPKGDTKSEKRARAEAWRAEALRDFCEARAARGRSGRSMTAP